VDIPLFFILRDETYDGGRCQVRQQACVRK
jgi:hypothetical protein